ncbi:hypothetical protein [Brachybacterium phenoliresistens]|uniref:hypothetical protein n=1 Tax=Brachybacterium phenoliresistens TaxID=396014 RepID=UPI0031DBECEC
MTQTPTGAAPNRTWIWIVSGCCVLLLIAALVLGIGGILLYRASQSGGGEPTMTTGTGGSEPRSPEESPAEESSAADPSAEETSAAPPVGGAVELPTEQGTLTMTFGAVDWDATSEVAEANSHNEPAAEGHVFITVPVTVSYAGSGAVDPFFAASIVFVGADGLEYALADPVVEKDFVLLGEVPDGGTAEGTLVFEVPTAATGAGEIQVSTHETEQPQVAPVL